MEMEDPHPSKRSRMPNGSGPSPKARPPEQQHPEELKPRLGRRVKAMAEAGGPLGLRPWHQPPASAGAGASSRICRVSRTTGGKDRHSKVLTAKGLRDRRVRLSVSTAIQFYDLQDRLGYEQPSKAVEWLIKAAAAAIAGLPSLDCAFPGGEEEPFPAGEVDGDAEVAQLGYGDHHQRQEQEQRQQQHISLTKSTCSSASDTSKGSVLSLSRSEFRTKARERARERTATAKEKDRDGDGEDDATHHAPMAHHHLLNLNPSSHSSFIELLTGGGGQQNQNQNQNHHHGPVSVSHGSPVPDLLLRHSPTSAALVKADFFGQVGLFGDGEKPHQPPGFPTQTHFNAAALGNGDHPDVQQQQQQFSFMPENLIPLAVAAAAGGDYINFSVASGIAGFNRGTLQSNYASPQATHHLQRLSSPVDGSNLPFFLSPTPQAAPASWEGPLPAGFDSRLQLFYDGYRHSDLKDLKGRGKS